MTDNKQDELKKLLTSNSFKAEDYAALPMQDLIILKKSAAASKEQNVRVAQAALFFTKREDFFQHLILLKLQKLENLYVPFAKATNLPYVICDEETFDDQVLLFSEEAFARKYAMKEMQNKRELTVIKLENKQFLNFYMNLFMLGVNGLVIDKGANTLSIALTSLVKKPDFSSQPPEKQPVQNPELSLTAIYFAQDRNLPKENVDENQLRELEEEMLANLKRGKLLMPVIAPEGEEKVDAKNLKLPYLKMQNGDSFQPVCSDISEFAKFNKDKKFRAITVDGANLNKLLNKEAKGIILNPLGVRLAVPKAKL